MTTAPATHPYLDCCSPVGAELRVAAVSCCTEPQVLVVDDDPHFRQLIRSLLSCSGISTAEAESGPHALIYLKEHSAGVQTVIVDLVMPEHDGLEVIRDIRSSYPYLKVLAVSGADARDLYLRISSMFGADAVLTKSRVELLPKMVRGMMKI